MSTQGQFDQRLLALVTLLVRQRRIVIPEREAAEGHVSCLVLHDVRIDGCRERIARLVADLRERGQREPFDQDLHAEIGHVPTPVRQHAVEQALERRRDGVGELELVVQETPVGLDVPCFVDDLRGGLGDRLALLLNRFELDAMRARTEHLPATGTLPEPDGDYHSYPWPMI